MKTIRPCVLVSLCAFALALALPAAETSGPDVEGVATPRPWSGEWQPQRLQQDTITLLEAVRLSIEQDPNLRLLDTDTQFALGISTEASGQFDLAFEGEVFGEYRQDNLTESQLEPERQKRQDLEDQIADGEFAAGQLQNQIDIVRALQNNPDLDALTPEQQEQIDLDFATNIGLLNILITDAENQGNAGTAAQLRGARGDAIQGQLDLLGDVLTDTNDDTADAQERLDLLGDLPDAEESWLGRISLGLDKTYRNGFQFNPFVDFTGRGESYKGKPDDPERGGIDVPDLYEGVIGFRVDMPLLRGRGVAVTAAGETAAGIDYEASEASFLHGAAASTVSTAIAYWNLVAAQRRLAVLEESLTRQTRLGQLSRSLIESDELPAAELPRIQAREATVLATTESARNDVEVARLELARAIGLEVLVSGDAPLASDDFPATLDASDGDQAVAALIARALQERYDLRAAGLLQESGDVLLVAAQKSLASALDLSSEWTAGYAAEDSISDLFSESWVGPSANLGLTWTKPFGNNLAKGALEQQEAIYHQRQISERNLERVIKSNVVEVWESLLDTLAQLEFARSSVDFYNQTIEAELERFRLGSSTLIDSILTEERTTQALLELIEAQRRWATLLARLRFETGTLVEVGASGPSIAEGTLRSLPQR